MLKCHRPAIRFSIGVYEKCTLKKGARKSLTAEPPLSRWDGSGDFPPGEQTALILRGKDPAFLCPKLKAEIWSAF